MTSAQRNNITSPANALLIYNTTNNSFEVLKPVVIVGFQFQIVVISL